MEELPKEILSDVVSASLDYPSLFALALASKSLRSILWKFKIGEYNVWRFIDDCCSKGYLSLLKFAFDGGAKVDPRALLVAVKHGQSDCALFLIDRLRIELDDEAVIAKLCLFYAAKSGNEMLVSALSGFHLGVVAASGYFEGGHLELGLRFMEECDPNDSIKYYYEEPNIYSSLARNTSRKGQLEEYFKVQPFDPSPNYKHSFLVEGSFESGNIDVIRWLKSSINYDITTINNYRGTKVGLFTFGVASQLSEDYLSELGYSPDNITYYALMSAKPESVRLFFKSERYDLDDAVTMIFHDFDKTRPSAFYDYSIKLNVRERSRERMECIYYLYDKGARWNVSNIFTEGAFLWVDFEQLAWLVEKAEGDISQFSSNRPSSLYLSSYLAFGRGDLKVLKYMVDLGIKVNEDALIVAPFVDQNFVSLEIILSSSNLDKSVLLSGLEEAMKVFKWIAEDNFASTTFIDDLFFGYFNFPDDHFLCERRPRYAHFMSALKLMALTYDPSDVDDRLRALIEDTIEDDKVRRRLKSWL